MNRLRSSHFLVLYSLEVLYISEAALLCMSTSDVTAVENHHSPHDLFSFNKHIGFLEQILYFLLRSHESVINRYS